MEKDPEFRSLVYLFNRAVHRAQNENGLVSYDPEMLSMLYSIYGVLHTALNNPNKVSILSEASDESASGNGAVRMGHDEHHNVDSYDHETISLFHKGNKAVRMDHDERPAAVITSQSERGPTHEPRRTLSRSRHRSVRSASQSERGFPHESRRTRRRSRHRSRSVRSASQSSTNVEKTKTKRTKRPDDFLFVSIFLFRKYKTWGVVLDAPREIAMRITRCNDAERFCKVFDELKKGKLKRAQANYDLHKENQMFSDEL